MGTGLPWWALLAHKMYAPDMMAIYECMPQTQSPRALVRLPARGRIIRPR